ncbi:DUF2459 domain-containing protein [Phreatobacter stygius]|uniref:DUF2459 domain-containing protein n=2 Tax=Phreatobacter stygius TaxID=1940610 RepID=A0A4D7BGQ6_9HYPH|nr:DUF2459 domain-containing protein [Phreatobacter stygius]
MRPGDPALYPPKPDQPSTLVHVVSHGWHSGLALSREALKAAALRQGLGRLATVLERFRDFPVVEIGWGEARFYQETPTIADVQLMSALGALFRPGNAAVLHVVGLERSAPQVFRRSEILALRLSEAGLDRLARFVDQAVAPDAEGRPREIGQGLYGPSLFYAATGTFSILQVCNHWVGQALAAAGLPYAAVPAIHPKGLFLDLEWRGEALPLPRPVAL